MVELDDRTGNILTTIALFAIVAGIAYATRTTITVFVLALLFAYVLEPAVTWVHLRLTPRSSSRNSAIGIVYLVGVTIVAALGLMVAPAITGQLQRLEAALLGIVGGALEFIPIAGWLLAATIMLLCGWLVGAPWIWMAVVIAVWKTVEGVVVSPRIMGHRLALEPITVLFALMAGGQIGGLLGVILSVPAAAVLRILWLERSSGETAAAA